MTTPTGLQQLARLPATSDRPFQDRDNRGDPDCDIGRFALNELVPHLPSVAKLIVTLSPDMRSYSERGSHHGPSASSKHGDLGSGDRRARPSARTTSGVAAFMISSRAIRRHPPHALRIMRSRVTLAELRLAGGGRVWQACVEVRIASTGLWYVQSVDRLSNP